MDINPDYNAAPRNIFLQLPRYHDCIEKCFETASSCWISADAFISEHHNAELKKAIEQCLSCSAVMAETVTVLINFQALPREKVQDQLTKCIEACTLCSQEVSKHCGDHEHCLICVRCCEECVRVCQNYLKDFEVIA